MHSSIGKKILLCLLAVALIPLIVAGLITYRATEKSMKQEVISGLSALSESTLEHFVDYVNEKKSMVTLLSYTPVVLSAIQEYEGVLKKKHNSDDFVVLDRSYRPLLQFYTHLGFSDLYLINTFGDIVFSLMEKEEAGQNILRGRYRDTELSGVFKRTKMTLRTEVSRFRIFPPTKKPAAFISAPVMKGRTVVGFMAFKIDTGGLYKHVKDYSGLGETGEIVLGERDGENILFVAPLRHDPEAAFARKVRIGSMAALPMQRALTKEEGDGISIDYRGKRIVAVWRYFAPLGLGLVIKQDASEAFSSSGELRRWFLIVGAGTLFFVLALSALVARSMARPIRALHEGAERVGAGDLSCRVGTSSKDEIGRLSRAFDDMVLNLQRITASRDELDKEIAQRRQAEKELRNSEERLLEYSRNLEAMVEKRTTALEALQKKMLKKEKLAAIGQLSSSVGHELRNPLGVIGNSVYYLNMKLKDCDDTVAKHLDILSREVRRSNRIISELLDFSRARAPQFRHGDIHGLIREALAGTKTGENIIVEMDFTGELQDFSFDPDQIHQLIVNVITNALQAMDGKGRLCIRTGKKDGFATISFEDSGEGISSKDLTRIFDPLYTTRARGTGLGLSIVKGIVERHGGLIRVVSKVGEGTIFTVSLPLEGKTG